MIAVSYVKLNKRETYSHLLLFDPKDNHTNVTPL